MKKKSNHKEEPFRSCANCVGGWVNVQRPWGRMMVPSQTRCQCWHAHQARLQQ